MTSDCLLCHDDQLEERCIAYVYYLTSDWSINDGGTLDLFDSIKSTDLAGWGLHCFMLMGFL